MKKSKIFVISGPSGVGKGTLVERTLKRVPNISRSVSVTTRKRRIGEKEDRDYYFVTEKDFNRKLEASAFLEWAEVHGNLYGTLKENIDRILDKGQDVILVIDVQGGVSVKKQLPSAVLIFIEPPSFEELKKRLVGRGTELPDIVDRRIKQAEKELACMSGYDHSIVNDNLDAAEAKLVAIIEKERLRTNRR